MMKNIKLTAFDMDGTLLNDRKELPPDFPAWVKNHPQIRKVIASGRQYYTLIQVTPHNNSEEKTVLHIIPTAFPI